MSNRSLLEFNHDYCPTSDAECLELGASLSAYMRAADIRHLPPGVVRKHYRHHSDPDPMARPTPEPTAEASDEQLEAVLCEGITTDGFDNFKPDVRNFRTALRQRGLKVVRQS